MTIFLVGIASFGQTQKPVVTGVVRSSSGDGIPDVVVNAMNGDKNVGTTTTDSLGQFLFDLLPQGDISFKFSRVGYKIQTLSGYTVRSGQTISLLIDMASDKGSLDDVVVIGYGTTNKRAVTGAVASIKGDALNITSNTNVLQALSGRVPGVEAIQTTGQPGASVNVKIRDNPSFASSGVLYVLDGVPINNSAGDPANNPQYGAGGSNQSPMNFINPNDIESIEVLKDASSAAIYGAQAGGGVVLITTKKGKQGAPKVSYSFNNAFQRPSRSYDIFDTKDYMSQRNAILYEKYLRDNSLAPYGTKDPSSVSAFIPRYTQAQIDTTPMRPNAMDAIFRHGFVQQHNLSISGISGKTQYFISGNYLDQKGVLRGSDYQRYNARINLTQTISNKVRVGISAVSSNSNTDNQSIGSDQYQAGGIIMAALYWPANLVLQNPDGTYPANTDYTAIPNPLSYLTVTDKTAFKRLLGNAWGEWEIVSGLKAKANYSYDQSTSKRSIYYPTTFLFGARTGGNAAIGETNATSKLIEYTLNYSKNIGENQHLNAVGGYSYQVNNNDGFNAQNNSFVSDLYLYNNLAAGGSPKPIVGSYKNNQTWASYFARAIYTLDNKYTLSASVRRDGSSIFAANKKYGYFPSVSAAWIVSDESFFQKLLPVVNSLKLRASFGTTGNSNIGSNALALYAAGTNYVFNNSNVVGVKFNQVANPNLTWETDREYNIGIDYSLIKGRITGSFDYFQKHISNLLTFIPLTTDFPVSLQAGNAGETGSHGWEIGLHSQNFVSESNGFSWSTDVTLSHYYSYWIQRSPSALLTLPKYVNPKGQFDNVGNATYPGQAIYGYVSDGIYRGVGPAPAAMPGLIPGGLMIKDLNGYDANGNLTGSPDGKISSADQQYLGSQVPNLNFGFNNTFRYKAFDLSVYFYGNIGALKLNQDYLNAFTMEATMAQFGWNSLSVAQQRWIYQNTNASWPSGLNTGYDSYTSNSSFWYEKADFIRCRDITLGYQLPMSALGTQKVFSSLRFTVGVQNPFIITSYKGADPELQSYVAYPLTKSINIGVNASF